MNIIRNIEAATLLSIGAVCAAAVLSIGVQTAHAFPAHKTVTTVASEKVLRVEIVGKRLTPAEKAAMRNEHVTL